MTQIVNPYLALEALRKVGYKSTATALAELVDNSIEAKAQDIDILALSESVLVNRTSSKQVTKIAVLDNGKGMTDDILGQCLSLGWGTRIDTNEEDLTLGKFGFGLKGSSISQARRIEVYSWQNVDWSKEDVNQTKISMACLDLDIIKNNHQEVLDPVIKVKFPDIVKRFGYKIKKCDSGTLVVWSNLDQLKFKRIKVLKSALNKDLCRIYRHFLIDSEDFGKKRNINIQDIDSNTGSTIATTLVSNDPLYLMTPNNLEGYENEATNVQHQIPFYEEISYENSSGQGSKSKIEFIISIAKPEIQALGGSSPLGVHYQNNCGISFVRAGREIDFGTYGFISNSEPRHRWWGIEIRFNPELDDLFGVTNSKQSVNSIRALDKKTQADLLYASDKSFEDSMLITINSIISDNISEMMKVITGRGVGTRSKQKTNPVIDRVNIELLKDHITETESKEHGKNLTDAEKIKERVAFLIRDDTTMGEEVATKIAKDTIDYQVDLMTDEWPGNLFLERKAAGNTSIGRINRNTAFYEKFWTKLEGSPDKSGHEALSIILMSLIRAEDELQVLMDDKKALSKFRQKWSDHIDNLLEKAAD